MPPCFQTDDLRLTCPGWSGACEIVFPGRYQHNCARNVRQETVEIRFFLQLARSNASEAEDEVRIGQHLDEDPQGARMLRELRAARVLTARRSAAGRRPPPSGWIGCSRKVRLQPWVIWHQTRMQSLLVVNRPGGHERTTDSFPFSTGNYKTPGHAVCPGSVRNLPAVFLPTSACHVHAVSASGPDR